MFTQYLRAGITNNFYLAGSRRTTEKIWPAFMRNLDPKSKLYFFANVYDCFCQFKTGGELDKTQQEFLIQWAQDQGYDRYRRPMGWFRNQFSNYLKDQIRTKRGLSTPDRQMQLAMILSVLSQGQIPKLSSIIWHLTAINETDLALVSLGLLKLVAKNGTVNSSTADTCLLQIRFFEFCIVQRNITVGSHFASHIIKLIDTDTKLRDEFKDLMRSQHPKIEFKFKNLISEIRSTIKSERAQVFDYTPAVDARSALVDVDLGHGRTAEGSPLNIMGLFGTAAHHRVEGELAKPLLAPEEPDLAAGPVTDISTRVAMTQQ